MANWFAAYTILGMMVVSIAVAVLLVSSARDAWRSGERVFAVVMVAIAPLPFSYLAALGADAINR